MDIWRIVPIFPDYEVSSAGEIRRIGTAKTLKTRLCKDGYRWVTLMKPKAARVSDSTRNYTPAKINRLVCMAFLGMPDGRLHAAHGNGDRSDDRLANLRWATPLENGRDQYIHGTRMRGTKAPNACLTDEKVMELRAMRRDGATWAALAAHFSVSSWTVQSAAKAKTWRHVKSDPA